MSEVTPQFIEKCAKQIAISMMAHYENHNVVTDSYECGAQEQGFTDDEIELASTLSLNDPALRQAVLEAVEQELSTYI